MVPPLPVGEGEAVSAKNRQNWGGGGKAFDLKVATLFGDAPPRHNVGITKATFPPKTKRYTTMRFDPSRQVQHSADDLSA